MASTDELLAALTAALKSKQDAPAPRAAAPKKARLSHIDDIEIHEEPSRAKRAPPTDDDFDVPKKRPGRPPKAAAATAAPTTAAPKERKMPVRAAPHSCTCPMCPLKQ